MTWRSFKPEVVASSVLAPFTTPGLYAYIGKDILNRQTELVVLRNGYDEEISLSDNEW